MKVSNSSSSQLLNLFERRGGREDAEGRRRCGSGVLLGAWGGVGDRGDDVEWFSGGSVSRWLAVF